MRAGTSDEPIQMKLAAGVYYLRVNLAGTIGTNYHLRLSAT